MSTVANKNKAMPNETTKTRKNLLGRTVTVTKKKYENPNVKVNDKTREVYNPKTGSTKTVIRVNKTRTRDGQIVSDKGRFKTVTNAQGGSTSKSREVQTRKPASGPLRNQASRVVTTSKVNVSNPGSDYYGTETRNTKVRAKVKGQKAIRNEGTYSSRKFNAGALYSKKPGA